MLFYIYIWHSNIFFFLKTWFLALEGIPKQATSILAPPLSFVKWVSIKDTCRAKSLSLMSGSVMLRSWIQPNKMSACAGFCSDGSIASETQGMSPWSPWRTVFCFFLVSFFSRMFASHTVLTNLWDRQSRADKNLCFHLLCDRNICYYFGCFRQDIGLFLFSVCQKLLKAVSI